MKQKLLLTDKEIQRLIDAAEEMAAMYGDMRFKALAEKLAQAIN